MLFILGSSYARIQSTLEYGVNPSLLHASATGSDDATQFMIAPFIGLQLETERLRLNSTYAPEWTRLEKGDHQTLFNQRFRFEGTYRVSNTSSIFSKNAYSYGQSLLELSDLQIPYATDLSTYKYQSGQYSLGYHLRINEHEDFEVKADVRFFNPESLRDFSLPGESRASLSADYAIKLNSRLMGSVYGYVDYSQYSNTNRYLVSGPGISFLYDLNPRLNIGSYLFYRYLLDHALQTSTTQPSIHWMESYLESKFDTLSLRLGYDSIIDSVTAQLNQRIYSHLIHILPVSKQMALHLQGGWSRFVSNSPQSGQETINFNISNQLSISQDLSLALSFRNILQLFEKATNRYQWMMGLSMTYRVYERI